MTKGGIHCLDFSISSDQRHGGKKEERTEHALDDANLPLGLVLMLGSFARSKSTLFVDTWD